MTRLAQLTFALLVCATLAAFFVTQRLKRSPLVVRQRTVTTAFSPNGDGIRERASIRFSLKRSDDVTVSIVDREGSVVRRLADDRRLPGGRPLQFVWNGRNDHHRVVRDGAYRVRVGLRNEGRTVTLRHAITVDTTPPRPTVTITSPAGTGAALFPAPGLRGVSVRTEAPLSARPRFQVFRMDLGRPRLVARFYGDAATGQGLWDGRTGGRPAPPGLYVIAVRTADRVGNQGISPPLGPPPAKGGRGRNGVIVRYVTVRAAFAPVASGASTAVAVDAVVPGRYAWTLARPGASHPLARGKGAGPVPDRVGNQGISPPLGPPPAKGGRGRNGVIVRYVTVRAAFAPVASGASTAVAVQAVVPGRYAWTLARPGASHPLARGKGAGPVLRLRVPRQPSGIDVLTLRVGAFRAKAPLLVRGPGHHRVLLVAPVASWQAANPYDDDGDGLPNTLDRQASAGLTRPFLGSGLPPHFATQEAPLLAFMDGAGMRYDLTTDLDLAAGLPPTLAGHGGTVLAGLPRWLPDAEGSRLADWVQAGGRVVVLAADALRRSARVRGDRLVDPATPSAVDALGDRQLPAPSAGQLVVLSDDRLGLFSGTDGLFSGFSGAERSEDLGSRVQAAAGPQAGQPVVVAYTLGRGLVIRTGLSQWSARLGPDDNVNAVTRRAWSLLSR